MLIFHIYLPLVGWHICVVICYTKTSLFVLQGRVIINIQQTRVDIKHQRLDCVLHGLFGLGPSQQMTGECGHLTKWSLDSDNLSSLWYPHIWRGINLLTEYETTATALGCRSANNSLALGTSRSTNTLSMCIIVTLCHS